MNNYEIDYSLLLEQSLIGVYLIVGNNIVYTNQSGARMFGYQPEEIINHLSVSSLVHPDDRPLVQNNIRKRLTGEIKEIRYTFKALRKNGTFFYCEVLGRRIDYQGEPAVLGTLVDITAQHQLQEILQESKNFNESLLHTIPLPMDIVDEECNILFMNQVLENMVGKEAIGQKCYLTFRDNRIQCGKCPLRQPFEMGKTVTIESTGAFGGRTFEVSHNGLVYHGKKAILEVFHDITESKMAEKRLAAQYAITKVLAEAGTQSEGITNILKTICNKIHWCMGAFWVYDSTLNVLHCTHTWCSLDAQISEFEQATQQMNFEPAVGIPGRVWSSHEAVWLPDIMQFSEFPRRDVAVKNNIHGALGFPIRLERKIIGVMEFFSHHVCQMDEELLQMLDALGIQIGQFISRKQAEEQIRLLNSTLENHVDELEKTNQELEAFSYTVSHDLHNPLTAIIGLSDVLVSKYSGQMDENVKNSLQRIQVNSRRMTEIIKDIMELSHASRSDLKYETFNLSDMVGNFIDELKKSHPERQVECLIKDDLYIHADKGLIQIVIENLIRNSWKYTAKKTNPLIEFGKMQGNGNNIYFIKDNGAGFDMQKADKMFKPFHRLHHPDEFTGTGVGLSTVHRIIQRHDGKIWAEGVVNKGASFYFTIGSETKSLINNNNS